MATKPMLLDFNAKIKIYEEVEDGINSLPVCYDVGPISLLSGNFLVKFNVHLLFRQVVHFPVGPKLYVM